MQFDIEEFSPALVTDWDGYLERSGWEWYSSRSTYILHDKHDRHSFAIRSHTGLCGAVHATVRLEGDYTILDILGISLDYGTRRPQILKAVNQALERIVEAEGVDEIQLQIPPLANTNRQLAWHDSIVCDLGFSSELAWGGGVVTHAGYYCAIDLATPLSEIKSAYSKSHRLAVNRGERSKVDIRLYDYSDYRNVFSDFRSLLAETMQRSDLPDYGEAYYGRIEFMIAQGNALLAESRLRDAGCSYLILDRFHGRYNYYAGCQSENYMKWSGMVHLHHEIIKCLKSSQEKIYGLGPVFPTVPGKMAAICEFKRRFGGIRYPYLCGRKILNAEKHRDHAVIRRIFPTYKDVVKYAVNAVLGQNAS